MTGMAIKYSAFVAALIMFLAITSTVRADQWTEQFGLRPGECIRSGYATTTCAPDAPPYFNRVERDQRKRWRSH